MVGLQNFRSHLKPNLYWTIQNPDQSGFQIPTVYARFMLWYIEGRVYLYRALSEQMHVLTGQLCHIILRVQVWRGRRGSRARRGYVPRSQVTMRRAGGEADVLRLRSARPLVPALAGELAQLRHAPAADSAQRPAGKQ